MIKKKIAITGALGLIGKELIRILCNKNYEIVAIDLKGQMLRHKKLIKNYSDMDIKFISCDINSNKIIKVTENCHSIIHLAAMLGVENTENDKKKCWHVNATGTQNILKACKINNINHMIFSSSSEVYGEQVFKKIDEDHPLLGNNIYAMAKIASENLIKTFKNNNKKFNYCNLRLFNTYGAGQVAKFFISKSCYNIKKKRAIIVNGNGTQLRGYCYSSDTAYYIYLCLKNFKKVKNLTLNVGNSKEVYGLIDLVKVMEKIKNKKVIYFLDKKFKKTDRKPNREIFNRICDTRKIISKVNFNPRVNIIDGIEKVLSQKIIYPNWPS
jgi:dTDP-glucose 4,6-dehydratase